ncbi:hypothetical protein [Oceanobacillus damuensis]|uniref:hypothetical protein n=1 Tax=Oceanobacillus damuensis TaxID=937928 RepID=UPI0008341A45|nr:hypothetical protein [Oceanobacillus damuensis]
MVSKELVPLQMECTLLFQSNPYMIETAEGISKKLGRKVDDILPIIDQLENQGILQMLGDEFSPLYRYKEPKIIQDIDFSEEVDSI